MPQALRRSYLQTLVWDRDYTYIGFYSAEGIVGHFCFPILTKRVEHGRLHNMQERLIWRIATKDWKMTAANSPNK